MFFWTLKEDETWIILLRCLQHNNNNNNVFWEANQNIRMIFEGSCDWINDAENSSLITGINYFLKYIQIENSYFK